MKTDIIFVQVRRIGKGDKTMSFTMAIANTGINHSKGLE
jgi:hypothetical protein